MIDLFPDQIQLDADLRSALRTHKSALVYAPPGFGKTVLAAHIMEGAMRKKRRAIFVCHRKLLLDQTSRTLQKFKIPHGAIASGWAVNPLLDIQVATVGMLSSRAAKWRADLIVCDEAHISGSPGWVKLIAHYRSTGAMVIGLSGSPERADGKSLAMNFDVLVRGPDPQYLIDNGRLAKFRAYAPVEANLSGLRKNSSTGDYATSDLADRFDKPSIIGDAVTSWGKFARGMRTVIYCVSVEHSKHTAQIFTAQGIPIAHMDGEMDDDERRRIILDLASGKIIGISSCDLLTTGFDLSSQVGFDLPIQCGSYLRPTDSLPLATQMLMRPMRRQEGNAVLLDHVNLFKMHGLPSDPHEWNWRGSDSAKKSSGERTQPIVVCGDCFRTFRPTKPCCPFCGHERDRDGRQIKVVDGELAEVDLDPNLVRQARAEEQAKLNDRVRQTRGLLPLARLAVELGRDAGWIFHLHKTRGNPDLNYSQAVKAITQARLETKNAVS